MRFNVRRERGDQKHDRKHHAHPKGLDPAGDVFEGRIYRLHNRKGWRNNHGKDMGFNLTKYLLTHLRRK